MSSCMMEFFHPLTSTNSNKIFKKIGQAKALDLFYCSYLDGESEKQTHLCRTIEIKMQTIANEKISFEVKFVQYIMYLFPELQNCE